MKIYPQEYSTKFKDKILTTQRNAVTPGDASALNWASGRPESVEGKNRSGMIAMSLFKKLRFVLVAVIVMTTFYPGISAAYDLYVQSIQAPVYLMPDSGSQQLFKVKKGDKLTGIQQVGYWHNVTYNNQTGWIYRFMVRRKPPVKKEDIYGQFTSLSKKYEAFSSKSRRRPSSYTAAAAARGLKEKRKRFAVGYRLDWESLGKIESIDITDAQAMAFLKKGMTHE